MLASLGIVNNNFLRTPRIVAKLLVSSLYGSANMSKRAVLFLAEGSEEMEAVIAIDVLRRGGVSMGRPKTNCVSSRL